MKIRYFLLLAILFLSLNQAKAQIENELKTYVDSTELIVNNGRKMLVSCIQENNNIKAVEIYQYLKSIEASKKCKLFGYTEDMYLMCLFSDWNGFLQKAANFQNESGVLCYQNLYSIGNLLYSELVIKSDKLLDKVNSSDLSDEDKSLLDIYLYLMQSKRKNDEYDIKVKNFKKKYPKSNYNSFLIQYLPQPEQKIALAFSLGCAEIIPTGNLSKMFNPSTGFCFSMDYLQNKGYFSLFVAGGEMKTLESFSASSQGITYNFEKQSSFHYSEAGFMGGYFLYRNKKVQIAPFLTIGGSYVQSNLFSSSKDDDKEVKPYNSFIFGPGLHSELKLFEPHTRNQAYYFSLKLDAGYNFMPNNKDKLFKGDVSYARLSLVWGVGNF